MKAGGQHRRKSIPREGLLALALIGFALVVGVINPAFFSHAQLFDLLRSSTVMGLFALGVLVVMISGGIDVSFTAIGVFAMYITSRSLVSADYHGPVLIAFVMAAAIGLGLGSINAILVARFRLPALIVTLGTASVIRGVILAFIGTEILNQLPSGFTRFARSSWFSQVTADGHAMGLSPIILVFLISAGCVALLLRHTMIGRGLYAVGGNPVAAERAGYNITGLRLAAFGLAGALAGLAGISHAIMMRNANPFDLVGGELTVLAAVVLGGASIQGGRGSVLGTVLGVFLLVLLNGSLILMGIPSYWQRVFIGLILLIATWISTRPQPDRNS